MPTRRDLLLASAGGALATLARAETADGPLAALPGKKPLIQRAWRPPNFETPLADLAAPFTPNDVFVFSVPPMDWKIRSIGAPRSSVR